MTASQANPVLDQLIEELTNKLQAGEPVDISAYADRYPEHAETLRRVFSALEVLGELGRSLATDSNQAVTQHERTHDGPGVLGDYQIIREVGRGGMGVVYEAVQVSLGRRVALKVLPFAAAMDPRQLRRFQAEAQAAAHLNHGNIVPVFAVGSDRGVHFYAMQFIEGRSLAEVVRDLRSAADGGRIEPGGGLFERPRPADRATAAAEELGAQDLVATAVLPDRLRPAVEGGADRRPDSGTTPSSRWNKAFFASVARLGVQAAEALEHAHSSGVLHRDVKPANLLVDSRGHLWVTDFGLAQFQGNNELTLTGDMLGTLRYMSPEQALAKRGVVDHRTDIYSLGTTLFELLTLRPAFDGRDRQELLRQIAFDEPTAPRRLNPSIPRDLETIVLKAMAKEPESRYSSAEDLADDLQRFLEDKPIRARRPTVPEQAAKWVRRHRRPLSAAAVVLVLAGAVGSALLWQEKRRTQKALESVQAAYQALQEARQRERKTLSAIFEDSDSMTMTAMGTVTVYKNVQGVDANQFYQIALNFYGAIVERSGKDPSLGLMTAQGTRRVAFTRMMMKDPKADEDYQRSIALFETLAAKTPEDLEVLQRLSQVLNERGFLLSHVLDERGFLQRSLRGLTEAEPSYRRALSIQRTIVTRAPTRDEAVKTAMDMHVTFGILLSDSGRRKEAGELHHEFVQNYRKALGQIPHAPTRRGRLAWLCDTMGSTLVAFNHRRDAEPLFLEALKADTSSAAPYDHLAMLLASRPDRKPHDPARAVELAKKAVTLAPRERESWHALGVAQYRAGDWKAAAEALEKALTLRDGGDASDWLFLAMARWRLGDRAAARASYDKARSWIEQHKPQDEDLRLALAEASALLDADKPQPNPQG
jgi:serine/threonine protein kinase/Flp pilus assembly protein TadD